MFHRSHNSRDERGFTLVELMVVVAIIGALTGLAVNFNSASYGANPRTFSAQLVATMDLAKLRAISTRKWHRIEITGPSPVDPATPNKVVLWQWSNLGMATPSGSCVTSPVVSNCWQLIQHLTIPNSVDVWDATTSVAATSGSTVTQNPALDFAIDFKPDGSSTGGTIFLTDPKNTRPWRVLVYHATGSSYARETW